MKKTPVQKSLLSFFSKATPTTAACSTPKTPCIDKTNIEKSSSGPGQDNASATPAGRHAKAAFANNAPKELKTPKDSARLHDKENAPVTGLKRPLQESVVSDKKKPRGRIVMSSDEEQDEDVTMKTTAISSATNAVATPLTSSIKSTPATAGSVSFKLKKNKKADSDDEDYEMSEAENDDEDMQEAKTPYSKGFHSLPKSAGRSTPSATPRLMLGDDRKKARNEKFNAKNEMKYQFLKDIRDAQGRRPADENYDPRTLFIPQSFWKEATPFEKQYWQIKATRFDTVVFFKKGKFYELFERDADLGSREFDLKLTDRAHMRMVGVPEASFEFWAAKFVAKGYKVARVDQLETQLGKEMREKGGKKDECIRRELKSVLTSGTLVDGAMLSSDMSTFCLSLKAKVLPLSQGMVFGVCFVDTATAEFCVCQLEDDSDCSVLETLLMQVKPKELVFEKGELPQQTVRLIKNILPASKSVMWNGLTSGVEFWDAETTLYELKNGKYFEAAEGQEMVLPDALAAVKDQPEAFSALGGLLFYLRSLKLDQSLVSQGNFVLYDPVRQSSSLILDGQTLGNLEIFQNSFDGGERGTLHALLNRCVTGMGKRLFKKWMCHPLRSAADINQRLDAVEDLNSISDVMEKFSKTLNKLPDLERLVSRVHAGSCRLKDFLVILDGFKTLCNAMGNIQPFAKEFKSKRLADLFLAAFPQEQIEDCLSTIYNTFDLAKAKDENKFMINRGVESDYDECLLQLKSQEKEFAEHLAEQKRNLGCSDLKFRDLGKEIYQIEVPARALSKVPRDWLKRSSTKALSRYHSPKLVVLVRKYQESLETKTKILDSLYTRTLLRFDSFYHSCWRPAVNVIAELDCLMSLARVSGPNGPLGETRCRPEFVDDVEQGFVDLKECRHPCMMHDASRDFIPNDIQIGGSSANMITLSGPNMGGKSTLLRQTCVAIIMAQLGCYVPAATCRLSPFDRIFTRIGANDNILAGQSTFMVELSETSKILHQATPRSMVILDELGRGTATFDGYAIAFAVLHYLSQRVRCCGLFSTHYGLLTSEFAGPVCPTPNVRMMHMTCHVDKNNRDVTFLYKLADGVSPKSFGMNVAGMAGVPKRVVDRAETKAQEMITDKGWIGCVGRKDGELACERMSQSLLVQSDFKRLALCKNIKRTEVLDLWRAARARYVQ